jgi:hypothetical protein
MVEWKRPKINDEQKKVKFSQCLKLVAIFESRKRMRTKCILQKLELLLYEHDMNYNHVINLFIL